MKEDREVMETATRDKPVNKKSIPRSRQEDKLKIRGKRNSKGTKLNGKLIALVLPKK